MSFIRTTPEEAEAIRSGIPLDEARRIAAAFNPGPVCCRSDGGDGFTCELFKRHEGSCMGELNGRVRSWAVRDFAPTPSNLSTEGTPRKADPVGVYEKLGVAIGKLVERKQKEYGDSVTKSGDILAVLYPHGIPAHAYHDALLVTRVLDKLSRIAQRGSDGADLGGESPWNDIAGYGILGVKADADRALIVNSNDPEKGKADR